MGVYKYIREAWKKPKESPLWKARLIEWRKEPVTVRISKPTRLDRARSLGYKAIQGFVIVRQRVSKSKRMRPLDVKGRRSKAFRHKKVTNLSYRHIAEQKANKKYKNCEVLGSYYIAEDGKNRWFEIIMVDRTHPRILADKNLNWLSIKQGRTFRGLTSAKK